MENSNQNIIYLQNKEFFQDNSSNDILIYPKDFSFKLEKRNNPFQINSSQNKISLTEKIKEIKREKRLKKNAECARNSRARKKQLMNNLIEENKKLKLELERLKNIIDNKICSNCKKEIAKVENILDNRNPNQKKFLFSTFSISIFLLIIFFFNSSDKTNHLRSLNVKIDDISKLKNLSFTSLNILFSDYYSLINKINIFNENKTLSNIRIIKEKNLKNDSKLENCEDCMIELEQKEIIAKNSKSGIKFKIFLVPKFVKFDKKNLKENSDKNGNLVYTYTIDCIGLRFSKNIYYQNK